MKWRAVALAVVTGCAGSTHAHAHPPSAPPATNTSPFNLQASDLPPTWTAVAGSGGPVSGSDPSTAVVYACLHLPVAQRHEQGNVASETFVAGQTLRASSDVTGVAPPGLVTRELAALRAPGGLPCLGRAIGQAVAAQGAGVTDASIEAIPVPGTGPDPALGVHYKATFTESGQSIDATADEFLIAHGGDEITVTFTALEAVFPASVEQTAVARLRARIR